MFDPTPPGLCHKSDLTSTSILQLKFGFLASSDDVENIEGV